MSTFGPHLHTSKGSVLWPDAPTKWDVRPLEERRGGDPRHPGPPGDLADAGYAAVCPTRLAPAGTSTTKGSSAA